MSNETHGFGEKIWKIEARAWLLMKHKLKLENENLLHKSQRCASIPSKLNILCPSELMNFIMSNMLTLTTPTENGKTPGGNVLGRFFNHEKKEN